MILKSLLVDPMTTLQPCNMDDLTINNGQITPNSCSDVGTTCLITCDDGYHFRPRTTYL